ncbi:HNH endonuclease signature motif containing protein [Actinoplanes subglobosus]|uniref:DUF222 domain-containing protein n=1 Tax=Actinoplanes subglobosus TaxID=1547892 RepID=A0ABV8J2V7_9ACTN
MRDRMQELTDLAAEAAETRLAPLSQDDLLVFLDSVHTAQQMLHAAVLHAVHEAERRQIPAAQHAPSPQAWLRGRLRISARAAHSLLAQASTVDRDRTVDEAVSAGRVNAEQLAVITNALTELPTDLPAGIHGRAAAVLSEWADRLDPNGLRIAGRRVLSHVAPEVADAVEERWLQRVESEARRHRYLSLSPAGAGRVRIRGLLDTEAAAVVTAALDPLCKPDPVGRLDSVDRLDPAGKPTPAGSPPEADPRTPGQRRADALIDVCRLALAEGTLPDSGGDRPQITVTVPYDPLLEKLGTGRLDNGEPVSAATVRRLGCDARVLPVMLNGDSQILDAGRARRTATGPIRRALNVRDGGCAFPGCDRPPRWCDAHHIISWLDGGPTDLGNLVLLCGHHHRLVHEETGWQIRTGGDGSPEFLPPTWLDPHRVPRRNDYHRAHVTRRASQDAATGEAAPRRVAAPERDATASRIKNGGRSTGPAGRSTGRGSDVRPQR